METLKLGFGLLLLVVTNILLGLAHAVFAYTFNPKKLRKGVVKAGLIIVCFLITFGVGLLNPDVASIQINGLTVDVLTALHMVVLAGYYYYTKQVIAKLSEIISSGFEVQSHDK